MVAMRIAYADEEQFPGQFELYRANTDRQIAGRAGQKTLRDLEAALLALPRKRLVRGAVAKAGDVCAVGALLVAKRQRAGIDYDAAAKQLEDEYDAGAEDTDEIAVQEGVAPDLVAWRLVELNDMLLYDVYENGRFREVTPEERYDKVLAWVRKRIIAEEPQK